MTRLKIDRKIIGYGVEKPGAEQREAAAAAVATPVPAAAEPAAPKPPAAVAPSAKEVTKESAKVIRMHEKLERPEVLIGSTYKVKTPVSDHAMYVTINDIILNEGTEHEQRRPFEIFINSKNLDHYQWIVALTRIMSAVFRKGGDVTFLVEELKAVFDPRGGYWQPGGKFMPSLIAEMGHIVEKHLITIGLLRPAVLDEHQQQLIDQKRREFEAAASQQDAFAKSEFPAGAQLCTKCNTVAVVMMDGCMTCLNCGDSKCG